VMNKSVTEVDGEIIVVWPVPFFCFCM
jgi:hypothetical protein